MNTKSVLPILIPLVLVTFVAAMQLSLEEDCVTTTFDEDVVEYYQERVGTHENGSAEYAVRSRMVVVPRSSTACEQVIRSAGQAVIRPEVQGYVCSVVGGYAECDSVRDGNGDGVCAVNGGETCCRIDLSNGETTCKDSEVEWKNTRVPVGRIDR